MVMQRLKHFAKHFLSQIPIVLVILDLHFDVVEGINKGEAQNHLSKGNQLLNAGQLAEALTHYHAAIDKDEQNYQAYYMRATVYLAMGKSRSALPDLNQVVKLRPSFVQARLQRGNLFLKMGNFDDAQADYEAVLSHEHNEEAALKVEEIRPLRRNVNHCQELMGANDFAGAIQLLTVIIESCPWNAEFRELRAGAYERVGDIRKAISDWKPTTVLKLDNTAAFLRMSLLWYRIGEVEQSLEEVRECLKLDPDHKECFAHYKNVKKLFKTLEAGKSKMAENQWGEAIAKYQKALKQESRIRPLLVEIKLKICECYVKANKPKEGLIAANEVLALESTNIPALILRSELRIQDQEYQQALEDLQNAAKIDENYSGLKEKIKRAQKLLKQSQKRDYYKILGVPRNVQKKDVIKAYRKLAREWHPDNFKDENEKKVAENRFIEIAAAKEVLTDPEKRQIVEDGFDPNDNEDLKEWEREQVLERTRNIFHFFFQRGANERKTPHSDDVSHDRFFRSFSRANSQKSTDQSDFENQFKEFQGKNFDHLKDFMNRENKKRFQQHHHKEGTYQHSSDHARFQHDHAQKRGFSFHHSQHVHKGFEPDGQDNYQKTETFESRRFQQNVDPREPDSSNQRQRSHQHYQQQHAGSPTHDSDHTTKRDFQHGSFRRGHTKQQNQAHQTEDSSHKKPQPNTAQQKPTNKKTKHTQSPLKKKAKVKAQFKKKNADNQEMAKRFTKGTDGKWYHKGGDGRWKVHNGPLPQFNQRSKKTSQAKKSENSAKEHHDADKNGFSDTKKNKDQKQQNEKQKYPDEQNKAFYKDENGHWYVKVDSPFGSEASSKQETSRSFQDHWHYQQHAHWRKNGKQKRTETSFRQSRSEPDPGAAPRYQSATAQQQRGPTGTYRRGTSPNQQESHFRRTTGQEKNTYYDQGSQRSRGSQFHSEPHHRHHQYHRGAAQSGPHPYNSDTHGGSGKNQYKSDTNQYKSGTNQREGGTHQKERGTGQEEAKRPRESTQWQPRSLFRNNRGEIIDKMGNIYERLPDGQIRLKVSATDTTQQATQEKQQQQAQGTGGQQTSTHHLFRDGSGNVYVKDKNGNLIKVDPKQTNEEKTDHFRERNYASDQQSANTRQEHSYQKQDSTEDQSQARPTKQNQNQWTGGSQHYSEKQKKYENRKSYYRPAHEEL